MNFDGIRGYITLGSGLEWEGALVGRGRNVVIEDGVRIFHPENVRLGDNVWVGHFGHIDGYYSGHVTVGEGTWIGPFSFLHGAAGLTVGRCVGIGPRVTVLTSEHRLDMTAVPVIHAAIDLGPVTIADGADVGAGAVILPGVSIGEGAVIGAGAVVTGDVVPYAVVAGNPAKTIRRRR